MREINLILIYSREVSVSAIHNFRSDIRGKGFRVWNGDTLGHGSEAWWRDFDKQLWTDSVVLFLFTPEVHESEQVRRELETAISHKKAIIPVLFEGDVVAANAFEVNNQDWVDVSSTSDYQKTLDTLREKILLSIGIDPNSKRQLIDDLMRRIVEDLPL